MIVPSKPARKTLENMASGSTLVGFEFRMRVQACTYFNPYEASRRSPF